MNKYEEAMDIIELSLDYDQLEEARNLLKGLIDKEEKYRWHDLRKNPNDLPSESVTVLLIFDYCGKHYIVGKCYKDDKYPWYVDIDDCPYADQVIEEFEKIIAWKYIEEFENE